MCLSFWLLCLSLRCDKSRSVGERQDDVLVKPQSSFVYDKLQLSSYRSGNRHSKERQANSFSTEWGHGFQHCSETHCLVNLFSWIRLKARKEICHNIGHCPRKVGGFWDGVLDLFMVLCGAHWEHWVSLEGDPKQPVRNYCLQSWSFSSLEIVQKSVSEGRQSFKNGASQESIAGAAD